MIIGQAHASDWRRSISPFRGHQVQHVAVETQKAPDFSELAGLHEGVDGGVSILQCEKTNVSPKEGKPIGAVVCGLRALVAGVGPKSRPGVTASGAALPQPEAPAHP